MCVCVCVCVFAVVVISFADDVTDVATSRDRPGQSASTGNDVIYRRVTDPANDGSVAAAGAARFKLRRLAH